MSLDQANVVATLLRNEREQVRIAIAEYKGRMRLDIRVWYLAGDEFRPGSKGISLPIEQLPALREAIELAQAETRPASKKETRAPAS